MAKHVLKRYTENVFDENGKKKGYTRTRTNSFVRCSVLHSGQEIKDLFIEQDLIHSEFSDLNQLIVDLDEESQRINRINAKMVYAINIVFMLPELYENDVLKVICDEITAKCFDGVPYFACKYLDGTAWCISFTMLNKHYYPEGRDIPVLATKDSYIDKTTGDFCKADNPNRRCIQHKGDLLKYRRGKFSNRVEKTHFNLHNQRQFMDKLKSDYYDILNGITNVQIEEGVSIDRYRQKELSSFSDKKIAKKWNDGIRAMEEKIDETISGLKCCAMFSEKIKVQIDRTVSKYRNILKKGIFFYINESRRAHTKVFIFFYDEEDGHKHMTGYRDLTGYIAMLMDNLVKDLRKIQEYAYGTFLLFY